MSCKTGHGRSNIMIHQQIKPEMWESSQALFWKNPSEETYYLRKRWEILGLDSFLDLGCGNGRHALFFAEDGYTVTAYDREEIDFGSLKEQVNELGLEMSYLQGALSHLPFNAASFDAILAYDSLVDLNERQLMEIINQIYHCLKTGGECYLRLPINLGSFPKLIEKFQVISYKRVQSYQDEKFIETDHLLLKK